MQYTCFAFNIICHLFQQELYDVAHLAIIFIIMILELTELTFPFLFPSLKAVKLYMYMQSASLFEFFLNSSPLFPLIVYLIATMSISQ